MQGIGSSIDCPCRWCHLPLKIFTGSGQASKPIRPATRSIPPLIDPTGLPEPLVGTFIPFIYGSGQFASEPHPHASRFDITGVIPPTHCKNFARQVSTKCGWVMAAVATGGQNRFGGDWVFHLRTGYPVGKLAR